MKKKSDDEKEAFLQIIRTQKEEILNLQDLLVDRLTDAIKESDDWKNLSPYHLKGLAYRFRYPLKIANCMFMRQKNTCIGYLKIFWIIL